MDTNDNNHQAKPQERGKTHSVQALTVHPVRFCKQSIKYDRGKRCGKKECRVIWRCDWSMAEFFLSARLNQINSDTQSVCVNCDCFWEDLNAGNNNSETWGKFTWIHQIWSIEKKALTHTRKGFLISRRTTYLVLHWTIYLISTWTLGSQIHTHTHTHTHIHFVSGVTLTNFACFFSILWTCVRTNNLFDDKCLWQPYASCHYLENVVFLTQSCLWNL